MEEKKKHKVVIGIEVALLCMLVAIVGMNAASSNPPSNGVSYNKNSQTTVEGALNDLYTKANYGNATAAQILKGKTALVGGKQVTGTYEAPSLASQTKDATAAAGDILKDKIAYVNGSKITGSMTNNGAVNKTVNPGSSYTIPAGYHNGSGKATCSTCESNGYYKVYTFEKEASYSGGDVVLGESGYKRLCSSDNNCTVSFYVPLEDITVNKLYTCTAQVRTSMKLEQYRRSNFKFGDFYTDYISAFTEFNESGVAEVKYGYMLNAQNATAALANKNTVQTKCLIQGNRFIVDVRIENNVLSSYGNTFSIYGSITYR